MSRTRAPRSVVLALVASLVLVLGGCGSSSDPESWEEAEEGDFEVRENFLKACLEANLGEGGFNDADADAYCTCSFDEMRESLTFDEFKQLDDGLRSDPDPSDLAEEDRDVWDIAEDLLTGCASQVGV